jgi:hypothetical protein
MNTFDSKNRQKTLAFIEENRNKAKKNFANFFLKHFVLKSKKHTFGRKLSPETQSSI